MHEVSEPRFPAGSDAPTLGAALEQVRLAHRVRRLEQVLEVLYGRARSHRASDTVPRALIESIDGFSRELARLREQVRSGAASGLRQV